MKTKEKIGKKLAGIALLLVAAGACAQNISWDGGFSAGSAAAALEIALPKIQSQAPAAPSPATNKITMTFFLMGAYNTPSGANFIKMSVDGIDYTKQFAEDLDPRIDANGDVLNQGKLLGHLLTNTAQFTRIPYEGPPYYGDPSKPVTAETVEMRLNPKLFLKQATVTAACVSAGYWPHELDNSALERRVKLAILDLRKPDVVLSGDVVAYKQFDDDAACAAALKKVNVQP